MVDILRFWIVRGLCSAEKNRAPWTVCYKENDDENENHDDGDDDEEEEDDDDHDDHDDNSNPVSNYRAKVGWFVSFYLRPFQKKNGSM